MNVSIMICCDDCVASTISSMEQREWKVVEGPTTSTPASSLPSSTTTVVVGSVGTSSCEGSTLCLFVVLRLDLAGFFCAMHCLRKVDPMGCCEVNQLRGGKML